MKPLSTNQKVLMWLCMCQPDATISDRRSLLHCAFAFTVFAFMFASLITSLAFFVEFISTDFEGCLYALFQVPANFSLLNVMIVAIIHRHHITDIFKELAEVYVASENDINLIEANTKCEWLWKMYFLYGMVGYLMNTFSMAITSILFCWFKYHTFDVNHLYHPYKLVLPWEQQTPFGYLSEILYVIGISESYLICNGSVLLLFISLCWHHQAFFKSFCCFVHKLEQHKNSAEANERLSRLIQFHGMIKSWFLETAEVYRSFVLIQLICNMLIIASAVFQLDLQLKHINISIIVLMTAFSTGIMNLFVYCYMGKLATESFERMADFLFESSWYQLPIECQKNIQLMIQNMQRPIHYHGFRMAILNLETFTNYIRSVVAVYMMFKTLTTD